MDSINGQKRTKNYLVFMALVISIIISANLSIILDIPYFRQIIPFVLLTIIPGLLMIQILKLNHVDSLEKIVLSVGLSLVFVTFVGMITNMFPYSRPLSLINLLSVIDVFLILFIILGYLINRNPPFDISSKLSKFNSFEKIILIISILLPTLSILGTYLVKMDSNYTYLYLMVFLIPILVIFMTLFNQKIKNSNVYLITIFAIGLSLILAYSFISNYIYGTDSHSEFYLFQMVLSHGKWQLFENLEHLKAYDACLTISVLPAVYEILTKFNDHYTLFKLIFVIPFALTPLIVYQISKRYNNAIYSFLAAIFIISAISFYSQTEAYRTYIAVFFFALCIMVFLSPNMADMVKKLLFIIFTVALIVSHYSSGYVYFFILLSSIFIMYFLNFIIKRKNEDSKFIGINPFLTIGLLFLSFSIMFLWYSQLTGASFDNGITFLGKTLGKFNDFFLLESRDPTTYQALGSTLSNAPLIRYINFITSWASIIFIAAGILTVLISVLDLKTLKRKFKLNSPPIRVDFLSLSISSFVIMAAAVILPFVLVFYSLPRLFYLLIVILAIFFILGGKTVAGILKIKKPYLLILVILIPILMSNIGITPQIFGAPNSVLLNPSDDLNITYYIHDSEAFGAKWLGDNKDKNFTFFTDSQGYTKLNSMALVPRENIFGISKYDYSGYTFLSYNNIKNGKIVFWKYTTVWDMHDTKEFSRVLEQKNLIYDSGGSEVLI